MKILTTVFTRKKDTFSKTRSAQITSKHFQANVRMYVKKFVSGPYLENEWVDFNEIGPNRRAPLSLRTKYVNFYLDRFSTFRMI